MATVSPSVHLAGPVTVVNDVVVVSLVPSEVVCSSVLADDITSEVVTSDTVVVLSPEIVDVKTFVVSVVVSSSVLFVVVISEVVLLGTPVVCSGGFVDGHTSVVSASEVSAVDLEVETSLIDVDSSVVCSVVSFVVAFVGTTVVIPSVVMSSVAFDFVVSVEDSSGISLVTSSVVCGCKVETVTTSVVAVLLGVEELVVKVLEPSIGVVEAAIVVEVIEFVELSEVIVLVSTVVEIDEEDVSGMLVNVVLSNGVFVVSWIVVGGDVAVLVVFPVVGNASLVVVVGVERVVVSN